MQMPGGSFISRVEPHGLPAMNHSIEIKNEIGVGTLGGFLTLNIGNTSRRGFLTSSHIVQPSFKDPSSVRKQAERYGSSFFSTDGTDINVSYLAQKNAEAIKEHGQKSLQDCQEQIDKLYQVQEQNRMAGKSPPSNIESRLQVLRSAANLVREKMDKVNQMPRHLGTVLVSSGRRGGINCSTGHL